MVELFDTYGVLHIGTAVFYFDLEDLVLIQSRNWYADKDGYLTSSYYYLGQLRIVRFHRVVAHAKPGQWVDHKDKIGQTTESKICGAATAPKTIGIEAGTLPTPLA